MPNQTKAAPLWTKDFIILLGTAVFMYIAMFMFTPTLPLFARRNGATDPAIGGLIVFLYTIGALVPRVFWGRQSDRRGRKPVYLIGAVIMLGATPFIGIFGAVWTILLFRMIQGVGFSASSTSAATMAVDLAPAARRTEGVGFYSLANTVGMAVGPALGLFMLNHYGNIGLLGTGIAAGSLCLGTGLFISYEKRRRTSATQTTSTATPKPTLKISLIEKTVLKNALVLFFMILPYGGIMAYIASYGTDRGIAEIGLYFSTYAVSLFLIRLVAGRLSDKYGTSLVLLPGQFLMIIGLLILFWADKLPVFLSSAVFFGLGYGIAVPVLQSSAFVFCPPERRGSGNATMFTVMDLALGLGAMVMGVGIKFFGYSFAFSGFALFVAIGSVLYLALLHRPLIDHHRQKRTSQAGGV